MGGGIADGKHHLQGVWLHVKLEYQILIGKYRMQESRFMYQSIENPHPDIALRFHFLIACII